MRLKRPSHTTVVAYLALFAALGGSAYAVARIDGEDLANRSVPGTKLERNTIAGTEVNEGALNLLRGRGKMIMKLTKVPAGETKSNFLRLPAIGTISVRCSSPAVDSAYGFTRAPETPRVFILGVDPGFPSDALTANPNNSGAITGTGFSGFPAFRDSGGTAIIQLNGGGHKATVILSAMNGDDPSYFGQIGPRCRFQATALFR